MREFESGFSFDESEYLVFMQWLFELTDDRNYDYDSVMFSFTTALSGRQFEKKHYREAAC